MNNSEKTSVAILASGSGTTAEAVIRATQAVPELSYEVGVVISNNPDAGVLDRVERLNQQYGLAIQTDVVNKHVYNGGFRGDLEQTDQESTKIWSIVSENNVGLVLLAGYLRKVGGPLLAQYGARPEHTSIYQARMLNTHPGILPQTKGMFGKGVHKHIEELRQANLSPLPIYSAQTLHIVSKDYDEGGIIAENTFPVYIGDTADQIEETAQSVEKAHIAHDINSFLVRQAQWVKTQNEQIPSGD